MTRSAVGVVAIAFAGAACGGAAPAAPDEEPPPSLVGVEAGSDHTCALTSLGKAYCWGANDASKLGDTSATSSSTTPRPVSTGVAFRTISLGREHTCALSASGAAYCWGANSLGELGDGTTTPRAAPAAVSGNLTFASLTIEWYHTCALTATGAAHCWGSNSWGQLGDGTTTSPRATPVAVFGTVTFVSLAAGAGHTCGVAGTGTTYCWGRNDDGEVGNGTNAGATRPTVVSGGMAFASVTAGGRHACGLTAGREAYCWGLNSAGQVGDGTTVSPRLAPVRVAGNVAFANLSAGAIHTCGLTASGAAYCWGSNIRGRLGDGTTQDRSSPVAVTGGLVFASVSAGGHHTCGLTTTGTAYCWGSNSSGQLGDGTLTDHVTPVLVKGF